MNNEHLETSPERSPTVSFSASTPLEFETLKKRPDFLAAARSGKCGTHSVMVQAREGATENAIRVGYTCSKKVGNAVARNRAKRRLRAAAREVIPTFGKSGWDYVLIGRAGVTSSCSFDKLVNDIRYALKKLHKGASS